MVCTFFGHRKIYNQKEIEPILRSTLVDLVERQGAAKFYVGNHGDFDSMVQRVLAELSIVYPITCYIVLAYLPGEKKREEKTYKLATILPDEIERVPKRVAILFRNNWMLRQADCVITYVSHDIGNGSARFKALAEKQGKKVIELSQSI